MSWATSDHWTALGLSWPAAVMKVVWSSLSRANLLSCSRVTLGSWFLPVGNKSKIDWSIKIQYCSLIGQLKEMLFYDWSVLRNTVLWLVRYLLQPGHLDPHDTESNQTWCQDKDSHPPRPDSWEHHSDSGPPELWLVSYYKYSAVIGSLLPEAHGTFCSSNSRTGASSSWPHTFSQWLMCLQSVMRSWPIRNKNEIQSTNQNSVFYTWWQRVWMQSIPCSSGQWIWEESWWQPCQYHEHSRYPPSEPPVLNTQVPPPAAGLVSYWSICWIWGVGPRDRDHSSPPLHTSVGDPPWCQQTSVHQNWNTVISIMNVEENRALV